MSDRDDFRFQVLRRDNYQCAICGHKPDEPWELDAHHIVDRHYMPFGGYSLLNGITLCTDRSEGLTENCHAKAEMFHATGQAVPGYSPLNLYAKIRSTYRLAYDNSLSLGLDDFKAVSLQRQIDEVSIEEVEVCVLLDSVPNEVTWALACERRNISEPLVLAYGKGRTYVADD